MQSRRRLTRRQCRKRKLQEAAGIAIAGLALGGLLIAEILFDPYDPPPVPEHYGQIEYCGVWWDVVNYKEMMAERDEYIKAEQAEDAAIAEAIRQASRLAQTPVKSKDWDEDEAYMLANIAMAEAEGEDTKGKALVILVVLNRVWSDEFPETIEEVITQSRQFTAYENGRYDRVEPSEDCYRALELVKQGWDESQGAMYFERTSTESTWHSTTLKKLFTHGNHTFYIEEDK